MQHKDTSQQAFLIIYLMCILSFIYFSLGRSRWVFSQTKINVRLRSRNGRFYIWFWNSSASSCLCHLTLLVSHLSSRDKWNLICDVEVSAGLFYVLFRTHPLPRYILFVHISAERKRARLTNKSLVCTKVYLFYFCLVKSLEFIDW